MQTTASDAAMAALTLIARHATLKRPITREILRHDGHRHPRNLRYHPARRLATCAARASAQHLSDGMAGRDARARRALRTLEAPHLQPFGFSVGRAKARRFYARAAHRHHVL